ncbi:MAG: hypothetical protein KGL39_58230 [Patescibacteria group bacterium]|nr:hypothetical protein [Patescibacteria group bacterium]
MTPIVIELCKRSMDRNPDGSPKWHAQIAGRPGLWSAGRYPAEAIGELIRCHPEQFNIALEYPQKTR